MDNKNDYANLTTEELLKAKKEFKKKKIINAVLIGFAIGIFIYGMINKGHIFMRFLFPMFIIYLMLTNSKTNKQNVEKIDAEIDERSK